jgi:hypothetical protein
VTTVVFIVTLWFIPNKNHNDTTGTTFRMASVCKGITTKARTSDFGRATLGYDSSGQSLSSG